MNAKSVKTVFKILVLSVSLLFFSACNYNSKYKEDVSIELVDVSDDFEVVKGTDYNFVSEVNKVINTIPKDLKIIKSANTRYKVKDVKLAMQQIKIIVNKYNAYISDLRFQNDLYRKENRFTIKVPQQYFDIMMDSIVSVAEFVEYENITTQDVTEEYIDIQARLKTKLEVKKRYESILRKNAKTVEDILATEERLRVIQEEIESSQGRLKYLTSKVSYSTIQIDLYETVEYKEEPENYSKTFLSKVKDGFVYGWELIEGFFLGLIHVWPLLLFGIALFIFIKKRLRK
jgi:hypothetical protein